MLRKRQQRKYTLLGVMGFQSHHKILIWTTVLKAKRKPLTGRLKSWAPKSRQLDSGTWGWCTRQESWNKLQQRWDATICTFLELARADRQDQAGPGRANTGKTGLYSGRDNDQHHEGVAVILRKEWRSARWNGSRSTPVWWRSEWRGSTPTTLYPVLCTEQWQWGEEGYILRPVASWAREHTTPWDEDSDGRLISKIGKRDQKSG